MSGGAPTLPELHKPVSTDYINPEIRNPYQPSMLNIHQYVNPEFEKYNQFLTHHFKQVVGKGGSGLPLTVSKTQVLSSASNQLTERKVSKPDSYKTVMCQAWLESTTCPFAENCRFAHGEEELRPVKNAPRQNSKYKTKLCDKYTTTGICPYGSRCLFIHPDPNKKTSSYPRSEQNAFSSRHNSSSNSSNGSIGSRPHPSWPLESPAFYRRTSCDESHSLFSSETDVSDISSGLPYDPFMMAFGTDHLARRLADVMDIWK
ncbi:hypothetical protein L596_002935 [Steinernema carpocapsae]|uniref:C3H1-type domain-containing protein n=1 Tax=Steinernema carpocapsae TaxID=34508 RepID=A0A4U8USJ7_STECR|nr:hypothetical protein L596_002935 [Steinernema carpocapsae]